MGRGNARDASSFFCAQSYFMIAHACIFKVMLTKKMNEKRDCQLCHSFYILEQIKDIIKVGDTNCRQCFWI